MSGGREGRNPLDRVAEEFAERLRRGESPDVEAYALAHPSLAAQIRELFPTLLVMEALAPVRETEAEALETGLPLELPSVLGAYRLGTEIGRGGMGVVFEAVRVPRDEEGEGPRVALKVVHGHLSHRPGFLERFLREASIGSRVRHPNVVHTQDAGVHERADGSELPYLVMEYVRGASLQELALRLGGRVPEPLLRHLAQQIAGGLASIHAAGIVHRDLKPSNVMVTDDRLVRIMDLGVARLLDASDRVSSTGQFVGSVRYAAPEQFHAGRRPVGPAADLYALGVTLYELATARHPFDASSPYTLMAAHLNEVPVPARSRAPEISPFFSALLDTLLMKDPPARFVSAREFGEVLSDGEGSAWWTDRRSRLPESTALITRPAVRREGTLRGRDGALEVLEDAWCAAKDGSGRIVVVRGESGLGKSRLLDAFADRLEQESVRMLYGSYPPSGGRGGLAESLLEALGEADLESRLAEYLSDTPDLVASFAAYLKDLPAPAGLDPLEEPAVRTLYAHLVQALSRERPLVWVVDDLQFASREDLFIVLGIARVLRGERALLVLTSRAALPAPLAEELGRLDRVNTITLEPLARPDALSLVAETLGSAPWVHLVSERLVEAADGNPFFLLEMAQEILRERSASARARTSTPTSEALRRLLMPAAIRDLVEVRLRAVAEEERPLLDVGALLGFEFDPEIVAAALDMDILDVLQILSALERRTGVVRTTLNHVRFHHHQVLEVLREAMPPRLARAYHARIARVLEARYDRGRAEGEEEPGPEVARLAEHALRGGETRLGHRFVRPGLAFLAARHAVREVLELCDLALATKPPLEPALRARILHRRVHASNVLGLKHEYLDSVKGLLGAAREAGEPELLARAYREQGELATNQGDPDTARDWLQRALALAQELDGTALEQSTQLALATHAAACSDYKAAVAHGTEARRLAHERDDADGEALALISRGGHHAFLGAYADADADLEAGIVLIRSRGQRAWRLKLRAFGLLGNVRYARSSYAEAKTSYEASLDFSQRIGDRQLTAANLDNLGGTLLALGRLGDALSNLEQAVELLEGVLGTGKATVAVANLGSAYLLVGDLDAAERYLTRALDASRSRGIGRIEAYGLHDRAMLKECRGDLEGALEDARTALALREARGREGLGASHLQIGGLLTRHGLPGDSEFHFRAAERTATETGEAILGARAALWLAVLGKRSEEDVPSTGSPALFDAIELHLLRHRAGSGRAGHADEARRAFEDAADTLPTAEARAAFRARSPAAMLFSLLK